MAVALAIAGTPVCARRDSRSLDRRGGWQRHGGTYRHAAAQDGMGRERHRRRRCAGALPWCRQSRRHLRSVLVRRRRNGRSRSRGPSTVPVQRRLTRRSSILGVRRASPTAWVPRMQAQDSRARIPTYVAGRGTDCPDGFAYAEVGGVGEADDQGRGRALQPSRRRPSGVVSVTSRRAPTASASLRIVRLYGASGERLRPAHPAWPVVSSPIELLQCRRRMRQQHDPLGRLRRGPRAAGDADGRDRRR